LLLKEQEYGDIVVWPYFIAAVTLMTAVTVGALVWPQRPGPARVEMTQADALDLLADGGFTWSYSHPGTITFTLPDGRTLDVEGGLAVGRWWISRTPPSGCR
jgi:hypothetical protein